MNKKIEKIILVIILIGIIGLSIYGIMNSTKKVSKVAQGSSSNTTQNETNIEQNVQSTEIGENQEKDKIDIVMQDNYFITQLNDIYYNFDEYDGKTIQIEGFPMLSDDYTFVGRYGPGCCSNDGYAYIEYRFSEKLDLIEEKDWIRVTGTLKQGEEDGAKYIYIDASNVEKLEYRGTDKVTF